jgi:hypothetical protein
VDVRDAESVAAVLVGALALPDGVGSSDRHTRGREPGRVNPGCPRRDTGGCLPGAERVARFERRAGIDGRCAAAGSARRQPGSFAGHRALSGRPISRASSSLRPIIAADVSSAVTTPKQARRTPPEGL